jgi:hypothetical protein
MLLSPGNSARIVRRRIASRRGQSLIEFALVALTLVILITFVLDFGRGLHGAQVIQSAADLAARELSRTPLPAEASLTDLFDPSNSAHAALKSDHLIYSEDFLAIDVTTWDQSQHLIAYLDTLPIPKVNKALVPLMFVSTVTNGDTPIRLLRFPGALVTSTTASSGYTVKVPVVGSRDDAGVETIRWADVVEPVSNTDGDVFSVASAERGVAAVRINYPFQAAAMTGFQPNPAGPFEPNGANPITADDSQVVADAVPGGGSLVAPDAPASADYAGTYGGAYGLGEQGAFGKQVRPFRRVISAQAMYRREVLAP